MNATCEEAGKQFLFFSARNFFIFKRMLKTFLNLLITSISRFSVFEKETFYGIFIQEPTESEVNNN